MSTKKMQATIKMGLNRTTKQHSKNNPG